MLVDDSPDSIGDLHTLVGYVADASAPTFILPVFKNLENGAIGVQVVDTDNMIASFRYDDVEYIPIKADPLFRRVSQSALLGVLIENDPIFLGYQDMISYLESVLEQGVFDSYPAFAHTIARITNNESMQDRFKKDIYNNVLNDTFYSRSYFLENNIIRERIYRTISAEYRDLVSSFGIKVDGDLISLRVPSQIPETVRQGIGVQITSLVRDVTRMEDVALSFDKTDQENHLISFDTVRDIKHNRMSPDPSIFDNPNFAHLIGREASIVIPAAADLYFNSPNSKQDAINHLFGRTRDASLLSNATLHRILDLSPVSLQSALLFRYWLMLDVNEALARPDFKLHLCNIRIRNRYSEFFQDRLLSSGVINNDAVQLGWLGLSMSIISLLRQIDVINDDNIRTMFELSSGLSPLHHYFARGFLRKWLEYSVSEYDRSPPEYIYNVGEGLIQKSLF